MATPQPTPDKVPEQDKPFIIAMVSAAITVMTGFAAIIGAYLGNSAMAQEGEKIFTDTLPLTASAWAFYLGNKQAQATTQ